MTFKSVGIGLVASAVVLSTIAAQAQRSPAPTDRQIQSQLEQRLLEQKIRGVTVTVRDRAVTVSGTVILLWVKNEVIDEARKIGGVSAVISTLTVARGESDEAIEASLAEKLRRYVFCSIFDDVNVEVTDGVATLEGDVTMPYKAEAMVKLASRIAGVQDIVNKIEALPVSSSDDLIRHTAALRIYNEPMFWRYAMMADPPIHIVVTHGRVTLSGVVLSEEERRKAERIARDISGVLSVHNKLRLSDQEPHPGRGVSS